MQLQSELEVQAGLAEAEAPPIRERKPKRSRKVTIRLTEELHNRLSAATERPGLGKSMVVEAALRVDPDSHRGVSGSPWAASSPKRAAGHRGRRRHPVWYCVKLP
jgi:hypothetical protein